MNAPQARGLVTFHASQHQSGSPSARRIRDDEPISRLSPGCGPYIDIDDDANVVRVRGELDASSGDVVAQAVAWLRRRHRRRPIVIDTTELIFVDVAGRRALSRALYRPDGARDWGVRIVVGAALARLDSLLASAARSE